MDKISQIIHPSTALRDRSFTLILYATVDLQSAGKLSPTDYKSVGANVLVFPQRITNPLELVRWLNSNQRTFLYPSLVTVGEPDFDPVAEFVGDLDAQSFVEDEQFRPGFTG